MRPSVGVLIVGFLLTFLVLGAAAIADRRGRRDQVRVFQRLSFGVMAITGVAVIVVAWVYVRSAQRNERHFAELVSRE